MTAVLGTIGPAFGVGGFDDWRLPGSEALFVGVGKGLSRFEVAEPSGAGIDLGVGVGFS